MPSGKGDEEVGRCHDQCHEGQRHSGNAKPVVLVCATHTKGMQASADQQAETQSMYECGRRVAQFDEGQQDHTERRVFGEVGVHTHGAQQRRVASVADGDAKPATQAHGADAECHEKERQQGGVGWDDGHGGGRLTLGYREEGALQDAAEDSR